MHAPSRRSRAEDAKVATSAARVKRSRRFVRQLFPAERPRDLGEISSGREISAVVASRDPRRRARWRGRWPRFYQSANFAISGRITAH